MTIDTHPKTLISRPRRTFTVTVGLSTVICSILVICAGFVALFSLGVLLGRGYDPESGIPELERIMPQPGRPVAPIVISDGEPAPEAPPRETKTARNDGILGQGDLAYPDSLKTPPPSRKAEQPAKPPRQPEKPAPPATGAAPVTTAANQTQPKAEDTQKFHYVYQVAAYKDQTSCERFAAKLKKAGIKARTQKSTDNGTDWYRIMVDFTGRPDDTDSLRNTLQSLGAGKPLLKTKTPAN